MDSQAFQSALKQFSEFLDPEMAGALAKNGDALSDETRQVIVDELKKADASLKEYVRKQDRRLKIQEEGLDQLKTMRHQAEEGVQQVRHQKEASETAKEQKVAESLISNL